MATRGLQGPGRPSVRLSGGSGSGGDALEVHGAVPKASFR